MDSKHIFSGKSRMAFRIFKCAEKPNRRNRYVAVGFSVDEKGKSRKRGSREFYLDQKVEKGDIILTRKGKFTIIPKEEVEAFFEGS